ncbi:MAG: hypothetical protein WCR55_14460, partial [Lentisphaerota bacterium]
MVIDIRGHESSDECNWERNATTLLKIIITKLNADKWVPPQQKMEKIPDIAQTDQVVKESTQPQEPAQEQPQEDQQPPEQTMPQTSDQPQKPVEQVQQVQKEQPQDKKPDQPLKSVQKKHSGKVIESTFDNDAEGWTGGSFPDNGPYDKVIAGASVQW